MPPINQVLYALGRHRTEPILTLNGWLLISQQWRGWPFFHPERSPLIHLNNTKEACQGFQVVGRASRSPPIYHPLAMLARAAPLTSQRRGVGLSDGVEEEKSIRRLFHFHFHFHFHFLIRLCNCCHSSCFAASCSGSHSSRVGNPLLVESLESRRFEFPWGWVNLLLKTEGNKGKSAVAFVYNPFRRQARACAAIASYRAPGRRTRHREMLGHREFGAATETRLSVLSGIRWHFNVFSVAHIPKTVFIIANRCPTSVC